MKTRTIQITVILAVVVLAGELQAQYSVLRATVAGGGGTSSGGLYHVSGTIGQVAAGSASGGSYAIASGFWVGLFSAPALSITRTDAEAILEWTGSGFLLQSADEVTGPWVDFSPGFTTDGVRYRVNTVATGHRKFFRLHAGQCIDLQVLSPGSFPIPWSFQGATFHTFDFSGAASSPRIQTRSGPASQTTGLDCDHRLEIDLQGSCNSVMVLLASSAHPATATAYDGNGAVTATATMHLAGQLAPETLKLSGPGITRVVIEAPAQETLLLQLCCD